MWESPLNGFVTSTIFPLGITIDENVITTFLNIAVKNNLITQQQRDSIVSYEIFRGDRTANKTVESIQKTIKKNCIQTIRLMI